MKGLWKELAVPGDGPSARSSHAVAIVGRTAYVFGGELSPRVPIDSTLYALDLDSLSWAPVPATGDVPAPRIGVTMVALGHVLHVFGGRDAQHAELDEFYSFDTTSGTWKLLSTHGQDPPSPPARSYHAMAADVSSGSIFVFGGCGSSGRLNDLWAYRESTGKWEALPLPPQGSTCVPRGGAGLVAVPGAVLVLFGFCGHELSDVHRFDLATNIWEEVKPPEPPSSTGAPGVSVWPTARSVFGCAALPPDSRHVLVFGGEVDPSDLGHEGAGKFSDEVFVFDSEGKTWSRVEVEGAGPGKRGWFPVATLGTPHQGMLIYGGVAESNSRLQDLFLLTVS